MSRYPNPLPLLEDRPFMTDGGLETSLIFHQGIELPSGDLLQHAIERTDAETDGYASFFMINCAHPSHVESTLRDGGARLERIRGVRANASRRSHAELDEAGELDDGNPAEFGEETAALRRLLRRMNIIGGCCGTDHRHADEIWQAVKRQDGQATRQ
jgi:homocysteine S-methyltransferase